MVFIRFRRAIEPTAGAVVYRIAMKTSAQPAELRASFTLGTVKKRMMTCGRPAVPIISDSVYTNMLSFEPITCSEYCAKPRSVTTWSSFAIMSIPEPSAMVPMRPSCGIGLPVRFMEMNTAGMV